LRRTNPKGEPGQWEEITWEEALTLVAERINEVRGTRNLIWQKGRSKAKAWYDNAFVKAVGAEKVGHGAYCSDAGYRACEYTVGLHGVFHPDWHHCRYLISWGWNILGAGGNKLCWITWPRMFLDARERGMKVVHVDPSVKQAGSQIDEWVPIKPGTDLAFFLALANVLIENGYVDQEYLKTSTNAPFLVQGDGFFLRDDDKEQVWDWTTEMAKPHDAEGIDPALEGEFTVDGVTVKPAFQLFKEHVMQYTPEWAEDITGVPAATIRRIAKELGENAMIGSTITLEDGNTYTYRPVAISGYHVTQQEFGFQACRAALMVMMLLGAIEAVGGQRVDFKRGEHKNFKKLDEIIIRAPPYDPLLTNSKYFPINSKNPSIMAHTLLNPEKYGIDAELEDVVCIIHMANPILSFPPQKEFFETYRRYKFLAVIDPWMSETADYFADVLLPAATIEKYEGPISVTDQYIDAKTIRQPPVKPLYQSKPDMEIYIDLCEKIGVLYGPGGYIDNLNKYLELKDPYKLDLNTKPTVRDVLDRWAKSAGLAEGIAYFETNGVWVKGAFSPDKLYAPAPYQTSGGIKHRLYGESLKRYQDEMKAKGADRVYWQDYTAFPTWREPTFNSSPAEYDMTLFSYKKIEFKQSRTTMNPLMTEIEPEQSLEMNPLDAARKGISDGDEVIVEAHNAVTGETRSVRIKAKLLESIMPGTAALSHHYGFWVHPVAKERGPTPNTIFFSGEGYVTNTADQAFHVRVKVTKA
jgi:anaerobic selenocysteine-containing dehydrogenase